MFDDFKEFIKRGSVVDMAVGIIIGAAFTTVVQSLVNDIIMPPIGLLTGGADFSDLFITLDGGSYASLADAQAAGAPTINYGIFINNLIIFLIVAFAVYLLVRAYRRLIEKEEVKEEVVEAVTTKKCPECLSEIPLEARRCAHCAVVV
ncbi:MAG TPA: large conductance mechanosensitive channel protein MscL, partial [Anaerolineae bacterium]|nr:large conductance mechanosensitive channel protein MscL [Anaerolineae bacterium]